jgi:hypothetical protein
MQRILVFLLLASGLCQTAAADTSVRVADGDCAALASAVNPAYPDPSSPLRIALARSGHYVGCTISTNVALPIVIDGQGAEFQAVGISVTGGSLTLRNASIGPAPATVVQPLPCDVLFGSVPPRRPIICANDLTFENVSVHDLAVPDVFPNGEFNAGLIITSGTFNVRNSTFANITIASSGQVDYSTPTLIYVSGAVRIEHSTFSQVIVGGAPTRPIIADRVLHAVGGTLSNSVFAGNSRPLVSDPQILSLGGNVSTDANAAIPFFPGAGDKIVADAALGSFGNHGGLIPTQALAYDSPARGAGIAQYCEALDARGYTRALGGCDAGAYEYGGGSGAITASGMTGTYFDAAADGHYVSIARIDDNGSILITWMTFDRQGNPAWIFGIGALNGRHVRAAMSQNVGGVLQPGGPVAGATTRSWGTVDVNLENCALAHFNYQSDLPEFGSGQFPLTRLTSTADVGCSD